MVTCELSDTGIISNAGGSSRFPLQLGPKTLIRAQAGQRVRGFFLRIFNGSILPVIEHIELQLGRKEKCAFRDFRAPVRFALGNRRFEIQWSWLQGAGPSANLHDRIEQLVIAALEAGGIVEVVE